ncbi:hypothetical protein [Thermoflexus hugenholtzii]
MKRKGWMGGEVVVNTDEHIIDEGIAEEIEAVREHRVVDHRPGRWANGEAPVDGCENRKGFLRTFLRKHRGVSKGYLQGYLGFLSLLLNERGRQFTLSYPNHLGT